VCVKVCPLGFPAEVYIGTSARVYRMRSKWVRERSRLGEGGGGTGQYGNLLDVGQDRGDSMTHHIF
jgi:hypothetical protein